MRINIVLSRFKVVEPWINNLDSYLSYGESPLNGKPDARLCWTHTSDFYILVDIASIISANNVLAVLRRSVWLQSMIDVSDYP